MRRPALIAIPAVLALGLVPAAFPAAQEALVIKNAKIIPVVGPPISGGSLVIEKGKIAGIGANVRIPAGAKVIDAKGEYVYPGLIAPLTAIGLTGYPGAGNDTNEIGTSVPHMDPYDALNPEDDCIEVARIDGVTTALAAAGSARLINGKAVVLNLRGDLPEELLLKRDVCLVFNTSARQTNNYPSTFEGISQFFNEKFERVRQYQEKRKKDDAGAKDAEMETLAAVLEGKLPVMFIAQGEVPIRIAVRLIDELKIKGILFTASSDILKYADAIAARKIPVIWAGTTMLPERWQPVDLNYGLAAVLASKGILFAFNESSGQGSRNVRRQPVPASLSVAYGLAEDEAIKALTINPARILGIDGLVGSLEVGKIANVVVCSKPILQASSKIRTVIIGGHVVPMTSVQTRLRDKYGKIVRDRLGRR